MNWLPYGPNAWLLRFAEVVGDDAFFLARSIETEITRRPPPGLIEYVPGFTSMLFEFDPQQSGIEEEVLPELLQRFSFGMVAKISTSPVHEIPVIYDGPDLGRVAELNELSVEEVIEMHSSHLYRVYLLGFSPGFPYLGDLDPRLHAARLPSPRLKVPGGSVAIGGEHTGIYTVDSPGGWNVIGRALLRIFDANAVDEDSPSRSMFRLKPGDRVRFVPEKKE